MRAVHEAVGENLFIVAVGRARDSKVGDGRIGSQRSDQFGSPVGAGDYRVVVYLKDCCVMYKVS